MLGEFLKRGRLPIPVDQLISKHRGQWNFDARLDHLHHHGLDLIHHVGPVPEAWSRQFDQLPNAKIRLSAHQTETLRSARNLHDLNLAGLKSAGQSWDGKNSGDLQRNLDAMTENRIAPHRNLIVNPDWPDVQRNRTAHHGSQFRRHERQDDHHGNRDVLLPRWADHSTLPHEGRGRRIGQDATHHWVRRNVPERRIPLWDDLHGDAMNQKLGGEACRQPIGRSRGQNPWTLPENEKRTPEGVLFL